ncbi:MAG: ATP-dependent DNA helicase [Gaiellaceae bacterium MAG52_C11]|nr:ATP-dependent DNA helicase [Candidatus Gaiellasilicea maunaloa]
MSLQPALRRLFGFEDFRPGQERVVEAAVEGRDTLALMPTGSGKSLTYQLAAMLRPTPTLVLSPLIALMKDQIDKLPPEVSGQATLINSSLEPDEAARRLRAVADGRYRLLYAAPERLRQRTFVDALAEIDVGLVVIDEVHCVSMWGHDFRPDYLFIRRALERLGRPSILGMTATATPETERQIAEALGRDPEIVRTSIVRPNLRYDVELVDNEDDRLRALVRRLHGLGGASAIVYARSRLSCEKLARTLRAHDLGATHYHAGLEPAERSATQEEFIEGRVQTVVATTAFGMGIDKPDIRLVALYNYPESLESYVQMIGRAGRDGRNSDTLLLASRADASTLKRFARSDIPTRADLRAVYGRLRGRGEVQPEELGYGSRDEPDPRVLVGMLEQVGLVLRGFDVGRSMQIEVPEPPADSGERIDALLARYETEAIARADRLVRFAESSRCRHRQVVEHFGETLEDDCGMCDVCSPLATVEPEQTAAAPLPAEIGDTIHRTVLELRWPLGRTGLTALLRGSMSAPRSARRSSAFGVLAAATQADVKRWIQLLEVAGALQVFESEDGFRLLRAVPGAAVPSISKGARGSTGPADEGLFERLRAWRLERAQTDEVPAYVVLHDATLRELATAKPTSPADLAGVKGFGPAKLERYAEDVLAVISAAGA